VEWLKLKHQILYSGWPCQVLAFKLTNSPSVGMVTVTWPL